MPPKAFTAVRRTQEGARYSLQELAAMVEALRISRRQAVKGKSKPTKRYTPATPSSKYWAAKKKR